MLCSEIQLVKHTKDYTDIKPLPCKRWTCEICQVKRRRQLIMMAANGDPNKVLTLTMQADDKGSPLDQRNRLHDAWKNLVKRILRQFALPPERRWQMPTDKRSARQSAIIRAITAKTAQKECSAIHYMAFLERTKIGTPHLHILLRCPFIPQDWIARQMLELAGSPICWIEAIHNSKAAIHYVTKYVTKAPAQFGNTKRYWQSRTWTVKKDDGAWRNNHTRGPVSVRRMGWGEFVENRKLKWIPWTLLADGWIRVWPEGTPWEVWGQQTEPIEPERSG